MQQVKVEHKKSMANNSKQVVSSNENKSEELNKREGKGQVLATSSRRIYRIVNSDMYFCKSESKEIWYIVRFNPSILEYCSCPDNSYRGNTCKHIFAIIAGIKKGVIVDVDKLPAAAADTKRDTSPIVKSAWNDDYGY